MKKIAILLSIVASAFVLASCATKTQPAPAADTTVAASHHHHGHDYKGEG
jgi:PBP1b-binding outer membrane lipoprotein LpoB